MHVIISRLVPNNREQKCYCAKKVKNQLREWFRRSVFLENITMNWLAILPNRRGWYSWWFIESGPANLWSNFPHQTRTENRTALPLSLALVHLSVNGVWQSACNYSGWKQRGAEITFIIYCFSRSWTLPGISPGHSPQDSNTPIEYFHGILIIGKTFHSADILTWV